MTHILYPTQQDLSFEQFIQQLPDEEGRYELVDGKIMQILPTKIHEILRKHDTIAEYLSDVLKDEAKRSQLNYWISGRVVIQTLTVKGKEQSHHPDVTVIDRTIWESDRSAYSALLEPPQLVIEVVSTNWEDDYVDKLDEYQRFGIAEYWIVDYLAIASRSYLGNPKIPTVFVHLLDENGNYQSNAYRESDTIGSRTFPELTLTVDQLFQA